MTTQKTTHLYCLMQNRLGAMDRVLAALTHRGIIPERMVSSIGQNNTLEMMVSFEFEDAKAIEKLVKFLQKQVYTLDARSIAHHETQQTSAPEASNITPLFVSDVINDYTQRRIANVNNG